MIWPKYCRSIYICKFTICATRSALIIKHDAIALIIIGGVSSQGHCAMSAGKYQPIDKS